MGETKFSNRRLVSNATAASVARRSAIRPERLAIGVVGTALLLSGCASKGFVRSEVDVARVQMGEQLETMEGEMERMQSRIVEESSRIDATEAQALEAQDTALAASQTAQDALERALAAGKLAEGQFVSETVLSDDRVEFGFDQASLSDKAREALNEFASRIVTENASVYIEIQGHTDTIGGEDYNIRLGQRRAEAVRRFLSKEHQFPLHRMSVISYGESSPLIPDARNRQDHAKNRRVGLVVLR